ncbi:MAG: thioredoxin family protein [Gemmatimonadota bacterium]
MTITREQFRDALGWDDWLEIVDIRREEWRARFDDARLGDVRADYQHIPAPRHVLCMVRASNTDCVGTVPYIARACEQAGAGPGVELRIAPVGRGPDLLDQFASAHGATPPVCVVFDGDWLQVGHWGPRPRAAQAWLDARYAAAPSAERERALDRWYVRDAGRSTLREFLAALRGEGATPSRRPRARRGEHVHKGAGRARGRGD